MSPWYAKAVVVLASIVMAVIRAPHGQRSRTIPVARSSKGRLEVIFLTLALITFFVPLLWVFSPLLAFADYPLLPLPFAAGMILLALGLWLFYLSHRDLGTNWSVTLEVREDHRLVTQGIYRRVRHPMYLSLLVFSVGQALALPNWVAGPAYGVVMVLLIALRLGPEERMMREEFGAAYDAYSAATKRLVPGVW